MAYATGFRSVIDTKTLLSPTLAANSAAIVKVVIGVIARIEKPRGEMQNILWEYRQRPQQQEIIIYTL